VPEVSTEKRNVEASYDMKILNKFYSENCEDELGQED